MNPLDTSNPFADATVAHFQTPEPAPDRRAFFVAKLTGKTDVSGVWNYDWTEQVLDRTTGLQTDANPRREGGIVAGSPVSPAVEVNNVGIDVSGDPVYVLMRQKGIVNGQIYYEFSHCCPDTASNTGTSSAGCAGWGWITGLRSSHCLRAYVPGDDDAGSVGLGSETNGGPWASTTEPVQVLTICEADYTVSLAKASGCGLPCLTLTRDDGSGGSTDFTAAVECAGCDYAVFAFARYDLCPEAEAADCGCDDVIRVRVECALCAAWYCVADTDTDPAATCADGPRVVVEVEPGDDTSGLLICSGPHDTEAEALAACLTTTCEEAIESTAFALDTEHTLSFPANDTGDALFYILLIDVEDFGTAYNLSFNSDEKPGVTISFAEGVCDSLTYNPSSLTAPGGGFPSCLTQSSSEGQYFFVALTIPDGTAAFSVSFTVSAGACPP